jgi:hypothetical protein
MKKENRLFNSIIDKNNEEKLLIELNTQNLNTEIESLKNTIEIQKSEINDLESSHRNFMDKINLEGEKKNFLIRQVT